MIAVTYKRKNITEPRDDAVYWRSRPPRERIAALEDIRSEYHLEGLIASKRAAGRLQDLADVENLQSK